LEKNWGYFLKRFSRKMVSFCILDGSTVSLEQVPDQGKAMASSIVLRTLPGRERFRRRVRPQNKNKKGTNFISFL
jgi:hypothetical protein